MMSDTMQSFLSSRRKLLWILENTEKPSHDSDLVETMKMMVAKFILSLAPNWPHSVKPPDPLLVHPHIGHRSTMPKE